MIELDIGIRNLASAISMGDRQYLLSILKRLRTSRVSLMPKYKIHLNKAHNILRTKGHFLYLKKIRTRAGKLHESLAKTPEEFTRSQWDVVYKTFSEVLENCRLCHEKML